MKSSKMSSLALVSNFLTTSTTLTTLIFLIIITLLFTFSACSEKQGGKKKLHIAVLNGKSAGESVKPITITIIVNGRTIADKQVISGQVPLSLIVPMETGNHTVEIKEETTDSVYKSIIAVDQEKWLRVVFHREGENLGLFEGKLQDRPFGYEFEKIEQEDSNSSSKEKQIKDKKTQEENIEKKLDELEEKAVKKQAGGF